MSTSVVSQKGKLFFPNLDGLRFFSFLVVFCYHCYKTIFANISGTTSHAVVKQLFHHGTLGVNFFFVLSGFLITFLLIREMELTGDVAVRKFYVRRILRIWPLFYACVAAGFLVFPLLKKAMGEVPAEIANPWYYIFMINNFDFMKSWPLVPDALILSVLWSVAVEEQFYLSWPVLVRIFRIKLLPVLMLGIVLATLIFRSFHLELNEAEYGVRYFHTLSVIGDMAIGGLLAYLAATKPVFLQRLYQVPRWVIITAYALAMVVMLYKTTIFNAHPVLLLFERVTIALLFGFIILEQNYCQHSFFKMERFPLISKLGTYTYGLYCLHFIGIIAAGVLYGKLGLPRSNQWVSFSEAVVALLLSIGIAFLSYRFFESWFLKLKDRFAIIVRG